MKTTRQAKAEELLAEALDRMMSGQPPIYGRTWSTCLKIKRFLYPPKKKRLKESDYSRGCATVHVRRCDTCGRDVWKTRWDHHKTWCNEENMAKSRAKIAEAESR